MVLSLLRGIRRRRPPPNDVYDGERKRSMTSHMAILSGTSFGDVKPMFLSIVIFG
jgi:hypothetical protein